MDNYTHSNSSLQPSTENKKLFIRRYDGGFYQMTNEATRDRRLTSKAFHLLCWLQSHHEDFVVTYNTICGHFGWGRATVAKSLAILRTYGYLHETKTYDERGYKGVPIRQINLEPFRSLSSEIEPNLSSKSESSETEPPKKDHSLRITNYNNRDELQEDLSGEDLTQISRATNFGLDGKNGFEFLKDLVCLQKLAKRGIGGEFVHGTTRDICAAYRRLSVNLMSTDLGMVISSLRGCIAGFQKCRKARMDGKSVDRWNEFKGVHKWLEDMGWSQSYYYSEDEITIKDRQNKKPRSNGASRQIFNHTEVII